MSALVFQAIPLLNAIVQILFFAFVIYFLSVTMYLFNRFKHVPSLNAVWKIMVVGVKQFLPVTAHRVKLAPRRVKHTLLNPRGKHLKVDAYPSRKQTKRIVARKKK